MQLSFERSSACHLYIGKSRAGKTRNMRAALRWQAIRYPRRRHLVYDTEEQIAYHRQKGGRIYHAPESVLPENTVIYRTMDDWVRIKEQWGKAQFHVIQSPTISLLEHAIPFCMEAGGCNIWIDEIDAHCSTSGTLPPALYELVHRGAHFGTDSYAGRFGVGSDVGWFGKGCGIAVAARRMANVHNDILAKATSVHCVYSSLPSDNERVAKSAQVPKKEFHNRVIALNPKESEMLRFDEGHEVSGKPDIWILDDLTDPG